MTPQQQDRAFDEFYRAGTGARGDTEWSAGLGLGLSIVDRLARLLDIRLDLHSTLGEGTTIGFSLPGSAPAALATPSQSDIVGARLAFGAGRSALIADDDPLALDAMLALVEELGFNAVALETFAEAHEIAETQHFDLVITDYHLGEGDGLSILSAQRSVNSSARGVVVSGDGDQLVADKVRSAGAAFFKKPVSPLSLRAYLSSLFQAAI